MPNKKFTIRLQDAAEEYMIRTKPVRRVRQKMLSQYANGYYEGGQGRLRRPQPLNIIDKGVQIIAPFLVTNNPRVLIETRYGASKPGMRSFAITLELAMAHLFDEINFAGRTLRPLIIDSLFGMGITKTGVWTEGTTDMGGWLADVGQPYCDRVDFNDYIADISARNREEMAFEGNRYRLPLAYVQESGMFKNFDGVIPDIRQEADTDPKSIADNDEKQYTELRQTVELQDIYLPDEGITITLPTRGQGDKIMRTVEWEGPEGGPYDVLYYKSFPDSIIPIAPVYIWLDISKTMNIMARKMSQNVEREKSIGVFQMGNDDDAERWKNAEHGDLIGMTEPEAAKEITIGGFNNSNSMEYLMYLEQQFATSYSNLSMLGGKSSQANTLGQEQMMQYNATRALDDMVEQFHAFTRSVVKKLAFFLWTNPTKQIPIIRDVGGIGIEVTYSEEEQEGDFVDYSFDIDPYSLSRQNPEMRFQKMMQLITGIVMPLAPLAMQQGVYPDVDMIVREAGRYLNIPNMENWWKSAVPPDGTNPQNPQQGSPSKSPGQANDQFGASTASRTANSNQAKNKGSKPSPSNTGK